MTLIVEIADIHQKCKIHFMKYYSCIYLWFGVSYITDLEYKFRRT